MDIAFYCRLSGIVTTADLHTQRTVRYDIAPMGTLYDGSWLVCTCCGLEPAWTRCATTCSTITPLQSALNVVINSIYVIGIGFIYSENIYRYNIAALGTVLYCTIGKYQRHVEKPHVRPPQPAIHLMDLLAVSACLFKNLVCAASTSAGNDWYWLEFAIDWCL